MSLKYEVCIITDGKQADHVVYLQHGLGHRSDGKPAIVWTDGDMFWYEYANLHRLDGPAVIYDKKIMFYVRGMRRRW